MLIVSIQWDRRSGSPCHKFRVGASCTWHTITLAACAPCGRAHLCYAESKWLILKSHCVVPEAKCGSRAGGSSGSAGEPAPAPSPAREHGSLRTRAQCAASITLIAGYALHGSACAACGHGAAGGGGGSAGGLRLPRPPAHLHHNSGRPSQHVLPSLLTGQQYHCQSAQAVQSRDRLQLAHSRGVRHLHFSNVAATSAAGRPGPATRRAAVATATAAAATAASLAQ